MKHQNIIKKGISLYIISVLLVTIMGCTMGVGSFKTNSHFAYPNSNIVAIGPTNASVSKIGFIWARTVNKDFMLEVYRKALSQSGGNLVIDYKFDTTTTMIYPIFITTLKIDGIAAKMEEIGKQELE